MKRVLTKHSSLAFTLIELLVTISIIVILISMLMLALNSARISAQVAETHSRLITLKKATVRFQDDIGYYPAILDHTRSMKVLPDFPGPNIGTPEVMYRYLAQDWFSITSPAEFLIGYGNQENDGYGRLPNSVQGDSDFADIPRLGIRHPGIDGIWHATNADPISGAGGSGDFDERTPSTRGKLYGPYIDIDNEQMVGRIAFENDGVTPLVDPITQETKVFYPGEPYYENSNPMVFVDTWGSPIRYYRKVYPNPRKNDPNDPNEPEPSKSGIARSFPPSTSYDRPTLSDYFVLRPFDFDPVDGINASLQDFMNGTNDVTGDPSTTIELQSGQFAYFSSGPDKHSNNYIRADVLGYVGNTGNGATDEYNADNIVEIGP